MTRDVPALRPAGAVFCALVLGAGAAAAAPDCRAPGADEVTCLACNIYYEARNQSRDGQLAVAMVTLNRLRSPGYPKSICEVVWEVRRDSRTGRMVAQFSWTLEAGTSHPADMTSWQTARDLAMEAMRGRTAAGQPVADPSQGALFFHASYVSPYWKTDPALAFVAQIGDHLFYRSRGDALPSFLAARAVPAAYVEPVPKGVAPHPDYPWARGAKLIRLSTAPADGRISATTFDRGRVHTVLLRRE